MADVNTDNNTIQTINTPEELEKILAKTVASFGKEVASKEDLPDPHTMKDMTQAVNLFKNIIQNGKRIKLILDSDCDGLGTYKLWYTFFTIFPYSNVEFVITDRSKDGYGFQPVHVDGADLYITSDCGITSVDAVDAVNHAGAHAIICDHHMPGKEGLPLAHSILDPYQPGCDFTPKEISGTFVLYFFLAAIIKELQIDVDPFEVFLPEVALTTISDVMPLTLPINRFVIKHLTDNFNEITNSRRYLKTFADEVNNAPDAEAFSFGLIPLINATQRMASAVYGANFLIEENPQKSEEWFEYMTALNNSRKEKQHTLTKYVEKYFKDFIKADFIVVAGKFKKDAAKGILGLISGTLARGNNKPALVLNYNEKEATYSGSGRSIGDLNILDLVRKNPYVLESGGHKAALGITIREQDFDKFWLRLQEDTKKVPNEILHPEIEVLGEIPLNKISYDFVEAQSKFEPFGHKFKKPLFKSRCLIKSARLMGKGRNHLTVVFEDFNQLISVTGVKFFTEVVPEKGAEVEIYYSISADTFKGGRNFKLMVDRIVHV